MCNGNSKASWHRLLRYLACYGLWIGLSALGIWAMLYLRTDIILLVMVLNPGPWILYAVNIWSILLLGLLWLGGVVLLEHYLRKGLQKNRFWRRVMRVFLLEAIIFGLAYGLRFLLA